MLKDTKATERFFEPKEAGKELAFLAAIVQSSDDAIFGLTLDGTIISWNKGAEKMFGYQSNEAIGQSIRIFYPPDRPDEFPDIISKINNGQRIEHHETQRKKKEGTLIDVSLSISPIKAETGEIIGVSEIIRDVSGQKRAAQYVRGLIEASLDPLVTISPEGKVTDVNEATVQITGVPREKLIGSDFSNYFTDPGEAQQGYQQVFKEGLVRDYPLAIRRQDGTVTDVIYNATVYKDASGNVQGVFAAARDITERKKIEEQAHLASAYARSLIEASLDPLVTIGPDGKITDVNHATELITGVTREWLIGTDFSTYFTEPKKAREGYRKVFKEGLVRDYPLAIHNASGRVFDVLYNASVYKDAAGQVRGVFAAARDVTDTRKASQYARSLIEASLDPLVTISADGKITDVNEATVRVTGVPREKLIGTDFSNYFTEPQKAREGYEQVFKKGFVTDYPLTIRSQENELIDVLYNASVYKDDRGNVLGVFAAARNVMKQKDIDRIKDEFLAVASHQLRTPITIIGEYVDLLLEDEQKNLSQEQIEFLGTIHSAHRRMVTLIQALLDTSRIEMGVFSVEPKPISIAETADSLLDELSTQFESKKLKLIKDLDKSVPNINADPNLVRIIIQNLCTNAIRYTPEGGQIYVAVSLKDQNILIQVKDSGIGIPKDAQSKIFSKFFRAENAVDMITEGTGLGLYVVKSLIDYSGGKVWFESEENQGTTFYVTIPLAGMKGKIGTRRLSME